jgi:DNA-binding HxlR family transcriptional regulator
MHTENITPCDTACPVRIATEIVGHKWTTLIIRDLITGKKRYSELLRSISGISPRLLALRLKELEEAKILTRTVFPTIPPTTEYALTELGQELKKLIFALAEFGELLKNQNEL